MDATFWAALVGIVWLDLLLSGDNAVVIALVCKGLPDRQQRIGMILGAGAAVVLRIVLSFVATEIMLLPLASLVAGLFLLWVAVKMLTEEADQEAGYVRSPTSLMAAVGMIAVADIGMSVDNVMALAALSHGDVYLMAFGVALSIPLVIAGAALISRIIGRFPVLVWAGSALLGWVAGGIIAADPVVKAYLPIDVHLLHYGLASASVALVLLIGGWRVMRAHEALA